MFEFSYNTRDFFLRVSKMHNISFRIMGDHEAFGPSDKGLYETQEDWTLYRSTLRNIATEAIADAEAIFYWRYEAPTHTLSFKIAAQIQEAVRSVLFIVEGIEVEIIEGVALESKHVVDTIGFLPRVIRPIGYPRAVKMPLWFIREANGDEHHLLWRGTAMEASYVASYFHSRRETQLLLCSHSFRRNESLSRTTTPICQIINTTDRNRSVSLRLRDLECSRAIVPYSVRTDKPSWLDGIQLIAFLHCQHWTGFVHNTFEALTDAINALSHSIAKEEVMFVALGWEGPYYRHPLSSLAPADSLGGHLGFSGLCRAIKDCHAKLLLFTPLCVADLDLVSKENWTDGLLKRPWGETAWMNWCDWDGDLENEGSPFMNLGFDPFRRYLIDSYTNLVRQYSIDGFYFDITNYWEDDERFDHLEGTRKLVTDLRKAFPEGVCCAENWYDQLLGIFPLFGEPGNVMGPFDCMLRYCRSGAYVASPSPLGSGGVHGKGRGYLGSATLRDSNIPYIAITEDWRDCIGSLAQQCLAARRWNPKQSAIPSTKLTGLPAGEII